VVEGCLGEEALRRVDRVCLGNRRERRRRAEADFLAEAEAEDYSATRALEINKTKAAAVAFSVVG
jgi:hypothetical protein